MPIPPVSVSSKNRPSCSMVVETRSRVTPAVGSTMLIRRPASQLNSDDLPTFGRPTMATIGSGTTQPQRKTEWPQKSTKGTKENQKLRQKTEFRESLFMSFFCAFCAFLWLFSSSPQRVSAVDVERGAGDVAGGVAGEEDRGRAEFVRFAEPGHRNARLELRLELRLLAEPAAVRIRQEPARRDGVHPHTARRPVRGQRAC